MTGIRPDSGEEMDSSATDRSHQRTVPTSDPVGRATGGRGVRVVVGVVRLAVAAAVLAAVVGTYATARAPVNPFNLFGFFTIQSNLLAGVAELVAGVALLRGRTALPLLRGAATTYIAVTGVVYNTLLTGVAGGVALPWANHALHIGVPVVVLLDWFVVGDRPPLPRHRLWIVIPYPLVWLAVVLARGATDGWVPYPFLDPRLGYGVIAAYCAAVTTLILLVAAAVWAASRLQVLRPLTG